MILDPLMLPRCAMIDENKVTALDDWDSTDWCVSLRMLIYWCLLWMIVAEKQQIRISLRMLRKILNRLEDKEWFKADRCVIRLISMLGEKVITVDDRYRRTPMADRRKETTDSLISASCVRLSIYRFEDEERRK